MKSRTESQEDDQLAIEVKAGETEAFRTIMDKYHATVFTLCRRMAVSPQDAEDATQETFFQLYRNMWKYQPGNGFRNWLYSIALNICRKQKRRKKIAEFLSLDGLWKSDGQDRSVEIPSPGASVEQAAIAREEKRALQTAISGLPEPLKQPLVLRYFLHMPVEEIARTLGLSSGNVRIRLHRAKMAAWTAFSRSRQTGPDAAAKGERKDAR